MDVPAAVKDSSKEVHDVLGSGYTENIYHRSLEAELSDRGISFTSEGTIPVLYKGRPVGRRRPDLFVADGDSTIIVELKAGSTSGNDQLLEYIDILDDDSNFDISRGILIQFGDTLDIHENTP